MQLLNISSAARQSFTTVLDGQTVKMALWWQPSDKGWYASVEFPVGVALALGRRVVLDEPIIEARPVGFLGEIYCRKLIPEDTPPGRDAWGHTHQLVYEP